MLFKAADGPKELMIIPNASHVDLYDKLDVIPFEKLMTFFNQNLKVERGDSSAQIKNESKSALTAAAN